MKERELDRQQREGEEKTGKLFQRDKHRSSISPPPLGQHVRARLFFLVSSLLLSSIRSGQECSVHGSAASDLFSSLLLLLLLLHLSQPAPLTMMTIMMPMTVTVTFHPPCTCSSNHPSIHPSNHNCSLLHAVPYHTIPYHIMPLIPYEGG